MGKKRTSTSLEFELVYNEVIIAAERGKFGDGLIQGVVEVQAYWNQATATGILHTHVFELIDGDNYGSTTVLPEYLARRERQLSEVASRPGFIRAAIEQADLLAFRVRWVFDGSQIKISALEPEPEPEPEGEKPAMTVPDPIKHHPFFRDLEQVLKDLGIQYRANITSDGHVSIEVSNENDRDEFFNTLSDLDLCGQTDPDVPRIVHVTSRP